MSYITPADAASASAFSISAAADSPEINPARNPAAVRCWNAYCAGLKDALAKGVKDYLAEKHGKAAYSQAMPDLIGYDNIQNYVACVAKGLLLELFGNDEASRLLYAAQVALTACRRPALKSRPVGRPKSAIEATIDALTGKSPDRDAAGEIN